MGPEQLLGAIAAEIAAERIVETAANALSDPDEGIDPERRQRIEQRVHEQDMEGLVMELDEHERQELHEALEDLCYECDITPEPRRQVR